MKKLLITSALAASLATGSVVASPQMGQADMNQIFSDKVHNKQVIVLSDQEMQATEGEITPAIAFIAGAAIAAIASYATTGEVDAQTVAAGGMGMAAGQAGGPGLGTAVATGIGSLGNRGQDRPRIDHAAQVRHAQETYGGLSIQHFRDRWASANLNFNSIGR